MPSTALLWFRRDLRLADHPALTLAVREFERVVPVFVLDDALLHGRFASSPRTAFMLGCLRSLDAALRERGSALVVRHGPPADELVALAVQTGAEAVLWTSDVAPFARARDRRVSRALGDAGVRAMPQGGAYVVDVSRARSPARAGCTTARGWSPARTKYLHLDRRAVDMSGDEQAAAGCVIGRDYPAPIVEHAQERRRAAERYQAAGR